MTVRKAIDVVVYVIFMIVVLTVAAGVAGMVMVGMEGRVGDRLARHPQLADFLARAAAHLNGEVAESRTTPADRLAERSVEPKVRARV